MRTQLSLWYYFWLGSSTIAASLPQFSFSRKEKVAFNIDQNWHIPAHLPQPIQQLLQSCSSISLLSVQVLDSTIWIANSTGRLFVKDVWKLVRSRAAPVGWSKLVWNNLVRPRISTFIWILLHRKTPTQI